MGAKSKTTPSAVHGLHEAIAQGLLKEARALLREGASVQQPNDNNWVPLLYAAQNGSEEAVKLLLQHGASANAADDSGRTALHYATRAGSKACIAALLSHGAKTAAVDDKQRTPLHVAAHSGHADCLKLLLEQDTPVDAKAVNAMTPLGVAARAGQDKCVELLLDFGADINIQDRLGRTPLFWAVYGGHDATVDLLLRRKAKAGIVDNNDRRPLAIASQYNYRSIVKLLRAFGPKPNTKINAELCKASRAGHADKVQKLLDEGADCDTVAVDKPGSTPLMLASAAGHMQAVVVLLDNGAKLDIADKTGATAISLAGDAGHVAIVRLLKERGAVVNAAVTALLHESCANSKVADVRAALDAGADVHDTSQEDGWTPLYRAVKVGASECIVALLDAGASANAGDADGTSALHLAAASGSRECLTLLLDAGARVQATDLHGRLALHLAAEGGHRDCLDALLTRDAASGSSNSTINAVNRVGETPLIAAARTGRRDCMSILLERGAKAEASDKRGASALLWSAINGRKDCMALLLDQEKAVPLDGSDLVDAAALQAMNLDVAHLCSQLDEGSMALYRARGTLAEQVALAGPRDAGLRRVVHELEKDVVAEQTQLREHMAAARDALRELDGSGSTLRDKMQRARAKVADLKGQLQRAKRREAGEAEPDDDDWMSRRGGARSEAGSEMTAATAATSSKVKARLSRAQAAVKELNAELKTVAPCQQALLKALQRAKAVLLSSGDGDGGSGPLGALTPIPLATQQSVKSVTAEDTEGSSVGGDTRTAQETLGSGGTTGTEAADANITTTTVIADFPAFATLLDGSFAGGDVLLRVGTVPLVAAAAHGHEECLSLLLSRGANIDATNEASCSALHAAAAAGHATCIDLLLEAKANANAEDAYGNTPLHLALEGRQTTCMLRLLDAGAALDVPNALGYSPLHLALRRGDAEYTRELLKHGARLGTTTTGGYNALHLTSQAGDERCLEVVLEQAGLLRSVEQAAAAAAAKTEKAAAAPGTATVQGEQAGSSQSQAGGPASVQAAASALSVDGKVAATSAAAAGPPPLMQIDSPDSLGRTPLFWAAAKGWPQCVALLLRCGASPTVRDRDGRRPLSAAVAGGHEEVIKLLQAAMPRSDRSLSEELCRAARDGHVDDLQDMIEQGAKLDEPDGAGWTALHWAADKGHAACVDVLLDSGASVNVTRRGGFTPLYCAVYRGHLRVVERLLQQQSMRVDARTEDGYTALLVAVQWQLHDCVRLLLDRGADVNGGGARGIAPLRYAAQNAGSTACLEVLLARGANLDAVGGDGCTALQAACAACNDAAVALLLKAGAAVGKVQPDGSTALHVAARAGSAACVELMLRAGAVLEATDKEGRTPLLCAAQCGHTDCLELLLSVGAKTSATTHLGQNALHLAAQSGQRDCLGRLIEARFKVDAVDAKGRTALYLAAQGGHGTCVSKLLQEEARVDLADSARVTPLMAAAKNGHKAVIRQLRKAGATVDPGVDAALQTAAREGWLEKLRVALDAGADVDSRDAQGSAPLLLSAQGQHRECAAELLGRKADVGGASVPHGYTPIYMAAYNGSTELVRLLLDHLTMAETNPEARAAILNAGDRDGCTALMWAAYFGFEQVMALLLEAGAHCDVAARGGRSPLYHAAKRGHSGCVKLLVDHKAIVTSKILARAADHCRDLLREARQAQPDQGQSAYGATTGGDMQGLDTTAGTVDALAHELALEGVPVPEGPPDLLEPGMMSPMRQSTSLQRSLSRGPRGSVVLHAQASFVGSVVAIAAAASPLSLAPGLLPAADPDLGLGPGSYAGDHDDEEDGPGEPLLSPLGAQLVRRSSTVDVGMLLDRPGSPKPGAAAAPPGQGKAGGGAHETTTITGDGWGPGSDMSGSASLTISAKLRKGQRGSTGGMDTTPRGPADVAAALRAQASFGRGGMRGSLHRMESMTKGIGEMQMEEEDMEAL